MEASLERTMEDWVINNRCNRLFKVVEDVINYLFKLLRRMEQKTVKPFRVPYALFAGMLNPSKIVDQSISSYTDLYALRFSSIRPRLPSNIQPGEEYWRWLCPSPIT